MQSSRVPVWMAKENTIMDFIHIIVERIERLWKHWITGWSLFAISTALCLWWLHRTPPIGYAIGSLAAFAAIMAAIMENLKAIARFAWIVVLFGFLWVETRAINEDKRQTTAVLAQYFKDISNEAQQNLTRILQEEHQNLGTILTAQQNSFNQQQQQQIRAFGAILAKQRELYEHQQLLAESLNGQLLPGNDPTPQNGCSKAPIGKDGMLVIIGDEETGNASVTHRFPHVVLQSMANGPVITLQRKTQDTFPNVVLQMRSRDGRVIALLNDDGFLVNRNNLLAVKRDKGQHSLSIIDEYGIETLRVRYINDHAVSVRGKGIGFPYGRMNCVTGSNIDFQIP